MDGFKNFIEWKGEIIEIEDDDGTEMQSMKVSSGEDAEDEQEEEEEEEKSVEDTPRNKKAEPERTTKRSEATTR